MCADESQNCRNDCRIITDVHQTMLKLTLHTDTKYVSAEIFSMNGIKQGGYHT